MTDKKTKKEKPSYELKITRRATVDTSFNYYEFEAMIDPAKIDGVKAIRDIEKIVTFARELTATEAPKQPAKKKSTKKKEAPQSSEDIKISELQAGDKVNINVRLLNVGDSKAFISKSDGAPGIFCKCDVEDDSGKMKLTLFGDQVAMVQDVKPNAWLSIENGYVKEYQGNLELSVGQWGTLEVVYNG